MLVSYDLIRRKQESEAIKIIMTLRRELGINFSDKKVLDVGCETGCKSRAMKECGADVYAVEPNAEALEKAYIANNKKFNCFVQDLPDELFGTFDIITMFLYRVLPSGVSTMEFSKETGEKVNKMQLEVTKAIAKLIKPSGEIIIEMSDLPDDNYLHQETNNIAPLMWQLKQAFEEVYYETVSYDSIFIRAKRPFSNILIDGIKEEEVLYSSLPLNKKELLNDGIYFNKKEATLQIEEVGNLGI